MAIAPSLSYAGRPLGVSLEPPCRCTPCAIKNTDRQGPHTQPWALPEGLEGCSLVPTPQLSNQDNSKT